MNKEHKIYLAGPMFNQQELELNLRLAIRLESVSKVFLPQRDGGKMVDYIEKDKLSVEKSKLLVYYKDIEALTSCNFMVAILNGPDVDAGTAFEIGYFKAFNKPIVALSTDVRSFTRYGHNPMIEIPCTHLAPIFTSEDSLIVFLTERFS